ncbi:MAG: VWA domain-containing protein [Bacteroidales bacterium]|nr:VWA domain-containing protein [Bacteroidales bacterium]
MFRKISVAILAFVLSAAAVFAQSSDPDEGGVVVSKTAKNNYNGTYTINIEAFVTGKQVTTSGVVSQPVDAVLVLDVSGSMTGPVVKTGLSQPTVMVNGKGNKKVPKAATVAEWRDVSSTLSAGQNIYVRKFDEKTGVYEYYLLQHGGYGTHFPSYSSNFYLNDQTVYSTDAIYVGGKTRLQALQESVKQFITTMKQMQDQYNYETKKDSEPMVQHRVSIITFSSSKYSGQNSVVIPLGNGGLDMGQGTSTLINIINNTIDGLVANGATEANEGMKMGYNQLNTNGRSDASKLLVFFTDGYPTSSSGFEYNVANEAIEYGYKVKQELESTLYVVSVINPAHDYAQKYMNYLSSNFPEARGLRAGSGYSTGYLTSSPGTGEMGGKYYMIAPDEAALKQAFVDIAKDFTSGGAAIELNSETITADIVMSDFQISKTFGSVSSDAIDVYVKPLTAISGSNDDVYTWGAKTQDSNLIVNVTDDPSTGNHIVKVSGFDFSNHWCGFNYVNGVKNGLHAGGQKLCLDIQLVPNLDKTGGLVATNDPISGLYLEDGTTGLGTQLATFGSSPVVYAPCDIIVEREGLKPGESVIYQMSRELADGQTDSDYEPVTIVVTADEGGIARTVVKGDATYLDDPDDEDSVAFYKDIVKEVPADDTGRWDWSYEYDPDPLVQSHELYTEGQLDNEFIFGDPGRKELDENTYDEAAKKNVFKKLNVN